MASLWALGGCGHDDRYRIDVDLRPDIAALGSDDLDESAPAEARLVAIGAPALPALAAALAEESEAVRIGVVEVLREIGPPDASPLLLRAAADATPAVRREAVMALGLTGDRSGTDTVERALGDPDPRVRAAAITACSTLCRSPRAIEKLLDIAVQGAPRAMTSLTTILLDDDAARADAARQAVRAAAVPLLDGAAPAERRLPAALLLGQTGDVRAVPVLQAALSESLGLAVQTQIVIALTRIRDPAAVVALRQAAGDAALRPLACRSLATLAEQQVVGAAGACP